MRSPFAAQATLLGALVLGVATRAAADTPYDARQTKLADSVLAHGKTQAGLLDILRMVQHEDEADPTLSLSLYQRIATRRDLDVQIRMEAARRVAWDLRRTGKPAESVAAFDKLGYVRAFRVVGPFDNEGKRGLDENMPPEAGRLSPAKPAESFQGRERMVRWRIAPDVAHGGYISLDALLRPSEKVCAFAETSLTLDSARPITLWLGSGGAFKLYFNGREVLRDPSYRAPHPDRSVVSVTARKGENRVLVKSCVDAGRWGFFLRVGDARGEPLVVKADPTRVPAVEADVTGPMRGPVPALKEFEDRVGKPSAGADDFENLARFLWMTGADDPAEHRARQLALQAAEKGPSAPRYLLLMMLSTERYEKLRSLARAEALAPRDPDVLLARAALTMAGPDPERALKLLDGVPNAGVSGLQAADLRVTVLRQLGLRDTALAEIRAQLPRAPRSTLWLGRLAEALEERPRRDEYIALQGEVVKLREDHVPARRALIEDAIARGEAPRALGHVESLVSLFPWDGQRWVYASEIYDALNRQDLMFSALRRAVELAPEDAPLHVRMGRALLRNGQTDAAADSLRKALALAPQDAEARELLEQLSPAPRKDEGYAIDAARLLARRTKRTGHPVTILQELTVNTVFENGLGSRFVQFGAQVHDAEGARRMRTRSIQFDPDSQRVDVRLARVHRADGRVLEATETYEQQLGEPWYRIYYDSRALVIVFPDLEPGDSVELRYRVDDISPRNLYADYFGDLHLLQGGEPRAHVEYVLITPRKRAFYFNEPKLASLRHERTVHGDSHVDRFVADNVPAIKPESSLPGATEISPYLHVSTYKTWEEVGRWYWGLIRDQLYADESLKSQVRKLVGKEKDHAEIVRRIYGWVVKNTRYVALEFGIHGYLPYRVPDVVRRGFGDCKDKASLIYTMLREAGIDVRIVLARTRRNGAITDLPASLAVFDHAIAYVPEFDMYLDGTAEHSGTRELPAGDQGITVLRVGPNSAVLAKTPVLPADRNQRERELRIQLESDGSGSVDALERVSGTEAAQYRQTYQAEGTRKDRFKRALASAYPGLVLETEAFSGLDDLERDIEVRYRLRAPQLARAEGRELRTPGASIPELLRQLAPTPTRIYPLELGVKKSYVERRVTVPPKGLKAGPLPRGGSVQSPFGRLTVRYELKGLEVVSETQLIFDVDSVPANQYPAFRRFIEQADDILRQRIALVPEKS